MTFDAKRPGTMWPQRLPRLIDLVDAPHAYGTAGQVLQLASGARHLEWTTLDVVSSEDLTTHENTPNAHHDPFVALEDNAGTEVTPAAVDARIQLKTGNSILAIAAGTNIITFTVAQGNIDHGSIAGLGDNDHPHYARKASAETISGAWVFTGTPTFSPNETNVLSITDGRVSLVNVGLNVGGTANVASGNLVASGDLYKTISSDRLITFPYLRYADSLGASVTISGYGSTWTTVLTRSVSVPANATLKVNVNAYWICSAFTTAISVMTRLVIDGTVVGYVSGGCWGVWERQAVTYYGEKDVASGTRVVELQMMRTSNDNTIVAEAGSQFMFTAVWNR